MPMGKTLLLVESPTKAKKLQSFLGADYVVQATFGHMMDLPPKDLGINLDTMEESYVVLESKGNLNYTDLIKRIKGQAAGVDRVILASDPDREGEAIAWHVQQLLKLKEGAYDRIELHEITKNGLDKALAAKRKIDIHWVDAQRARRVLDRLMGYGISPVLMRAIDQARSAGRVQSAALRMIVERDREHEKFKPENRYSVEGSFRQNDTEFATHLLKTTGVYDYATPLDHDDQQDSPDAQDDSAGKKRKKKFVSAEPVGKLVEAIQNVPATEWSVIDVETKTTTVNPRPPLITSTLQQLGLRRFGWSGEQTMKVAQKLFESGYITYMRTDSVRIADEAQEEARTYLSAQYGVDMVPSKPNVFKNKDAAQNAHEAIRPTHVADTSKEVTIDEDKSVNNIDARMLYDAIREVYLCSQAAPGTNTVTIATVEDTDAKFQFEASLTVWDFPGWRAISKEEPKPSGELKAQKGSVQFVAAKEIVSQTRPKPRYKEDTLTQDLEKNGVGRPSSYANIVKTLKARTYVASKGKDLISTELGRKATDWLVERASQYTDVHYTALMEERLDKIAAGNENKQAIMEEVRDDLKRTFNAFQAPGTGKPTEKQLALMNSIKAKGESVPDDAFETLNGARAFLDAYMSGRGPSEKQVEFALNLANATGMEYSDTMRMSAQMTKKFIDDAVLYAQKHNIRTGGGADRPASEKQVAMAKKLAEENNIAWDSALEGSMQKISAFIDQYMGKGGGNERPASEKQIAMAKKLADEKGVVWDASLEGSMRRISEFIDKHMGSSPRGAASAGTDRPPSEKQIALAENIAQRHGVDYTKAMRASMKKTSEFIDKYFKK